jgi:hypothetical protein
MENRMKGLDYIEKTREYLDYLEEHLLNVEWAWKLVQVACPHLPCVSDDYRHAVLDAEVKEHDISKLGKYEFVQYREHFFPLSGEDIQHADFKRAWQHHKWCNSHHWEHWTNEDEMPETSQDPYAKEIACTHMVIDWLAMGRKFDEVPGAYYEQNRDSIKLPEWADAYVRDICGTVRNYLAQPCEWVLDGAEPYMSYWTACEHQETVRAIECPNCLRQVKEAQ